MPLDDLGFQQLKYSYINPKCLILGNNCHERNLTYFLNICEILDLIISTKEKEVEEPTIIKQYTFAYKSYISSSFSHLWITYNIEYSVRVY